MDGFQRDKKFFLQKVQSCQELSKPFNGTLPKGSRVHSTLLRNAHWTSVHLFTSILPFKHTIVHSSKIAVVLLAFR